MRRQGLFFLLAAAAIGVMFFAPFATVERVGAFPWDTYPLLILAIVGCLTPLVLAFLPSKRDIQVRFGAAAIVVQLGLLGFAIYFSTALKNGAVMGFGTIMPLIAVILMVLAIRFVISDMKIIKNSNRLR